MPTLHVWSLQFLREGEQLADPYCYLEHDGVSGTCSKGESVMQLRTMEGEIALIWRRDYFCCPRDVSDLPF